MAFTTPDGKVLIRAYIGKPGDTVVQDHTDEEIVSIVRRDLSQMMKFKGDPEFSIVNRLPKSMPQYKVGHIDKIKDIQTHVKKLIQTYELLVLHLKQSVYRLY